MAIDELTAINNQQLIDAISLRVQSDLGLDWQEMRTLQRSSKVSGIKILTDSSGNKLGYVAWANVNKETAVQLLRHNIPPIYHYEWSEGKVCLLTDVLFLPGNRQAAQKSLTTFLVNKRAILFQRKNRVALLIRKMNKFKFFSKTWKFK